MPSILMALRFAMHVSLCATLSYHNFNSQGMNPSIWTVSRRFALLVAQSRAWGDLGCGDDKGIRAQRSTVRFAFAYPFLNQLLHRRISKTGLHCHVKLRSAIAVVYQARSTSTAPANGLATIVVEFCGLDTRSENGQTTGHTRPLIEP